MNIRHVDFVTFVSTVVTFCFSTFLVIVMEENMLAHARAICRSIAAAFLVTCLALVQRSPCEGAEPPLADRLAPLIAAHQGKVAIAIRHLGSGSEFLHQADEPMPTASLIKFPVMVAAYRYADQNQLDLNKLLTLRAEDKVQGSGILTTHFSPGATISLRDAIRLMIAYSDNTATNLVLDELGLKTTAETMEQLGLPNTKIHSKVFRGETSIFPHRSKTFGLGSTTPREMLQLLTLLHERKLATESSCNAMLDHLTACQDKDKIVRDLPDGTKVAHKTGSVNAVRTDAGIMFTPKGPIAICVMTAENDDKRWTRENSGEILCGRIARVAYDHFNPSETVTPPAPAIGPLRIGATGQLVEALQRTLNERLKGTLELSVDGEFGPVTREAVVHFQTANKLSVTGELDAETWRALGPLRLEQAAIPDPEISNKESLPIQPPDSLSGPPWVTCKAWAIADAKTGVMLWGQNERDKLHFASTTKVMTAFLVLQHAAQDAKVLDESITFSKRADETIGSTADIRAGELVTVRELLYGLLLPSGNDAATALAEHFGNRFNVGGGSSPSADGLAAFVEQMNRTAASLGMRDTHFANPHGLTDDTHQSTAADLLVLAHAARQLPEFRHYTTTRQRGARVGSTTGYTRNVIWKNTNKLLGITGYAGVKTGTTDAAGACLISAGQHQDDELIVVVLGSASSDARYVDTRNLFRWAWNERR